MVWGVWIVYVTCDTEIQASVRDGQTLYLYTGTWVGKKEQAPRAHQIIYMYISTRSADTPVHHCLHEITRLIENVVPVVPHPFTPE